MIIHLATDHAGFTLKEFVREALEKLDYEVVDHGAYEYEEGDDYPDYIKLAARAVAENPDEDRAIIFGGSGQGEAMVANRFLGVRATVYYHFDPEIIKLSRAHNNANILSIGARFVGEEEALESILFWLELPFDGGRHERRIQKIDQIDYSDYDEFLG